MIAFFLSFQVNTGDAFRKLNRTTEETLRGMWSPVPWWSQRRRGNSSRESTIRQWPPRDSRTRGRFWKPVPLLLLVTMLAGPKQQ